MTICHLHLTGEPVAHGFHAGTNTGGNPAIFAGRNRQHADQLAAYQKRLRRHAWTWLDTNPPISRTNRDPIILAAIFTHQASGPGWHTSRRGGDLTTVTRAAEDALPAVLYPDDARIVAHLTADLVDTAAAVDLWIAHADQLDQVIGIWRANLTPGLTGTTGTRETAQNPPDRPPVISEASTPEACSRSIPALSSPLRDTPSGQTRNRLGDAVVDSLLDWGV